MLSCNVYSLCHNCLLYYIQEVRGNERIFRKSCWLLALSVISYGMLWSMEHMVTYTWYRYWNSLHSFNLTLNRIFAILYIENERGTPQ